MSGAIVIVDQPGFSKILATVLGRAGIKKGEIKRYPTPSALLADLSLNQFSVACFITELYFLYGEGKQTSAELSPAQLDIILSREGMAQDEIEQLSKKERASIEHYLRQIEIILSRKKNAQTPPNGIELIRKLRQSPGSAYKETPIVVWAGSIGPLQRGLIKLAGRTNVTIVNKEQGQKEQRQKDYLDVEDLAALIQSLI